MLRAVAALSMLMISAAVPAASADAVINGDDPRVEEPVPVKRATPLFPSSAMRDGIEGRVLASFTVLPDGSVSDIVIHDSTGPDFAAAVVAAMATWQYTPAMRDGQPIAYHNQYVYMPFLLQGVGLAMSAHTKRQLERLVTDQKAGKFDKVAEGLGPLRRRAMTLSDHIMVDLLEVDYRLAVKDPDPALRILTTLAEHKNLGPNFQGRQLLRKLAVEVDQGRLGEAVRTLENYKELGLPVPDGMAATVERLDAALTNPRPVVTLTLTHPVCRGTAACAPGTAYHLHTPLYRRVTARVEAGRLTDVRAHCQGGNFPMPSDNGSAWEFPAEWGTCRLGLTGETATRLTLEEG